MTVHAGQPAAEIVRSVPPVSLGGADLGRCLTRLHHDRFTEAITVVDEVAERRAQAGIDHEAMVLDAIAAVFGTDVIHIDPFDDPYQATTAALQTGAKLIVGGRIATPDGSLVGAPDLLVQHTDGYVAVEVKGHFVLSGSGIPCVVSPLADLIATSLVDIAVPDPDRAVDTGHPRFRANRRRDLYQIAHYWRILDLLGHATPSAHGGVIGTEDPLTCAWVDLSVGDRSIVDTAAALADEALEALRSGAAHPDNPAVAPFWRGECRGCPWNELCRTALEDADDPTLIPGIGPETRATLALSGITTGRAIADLPADNELLDDQSPVLIARARTAGKLLRRRRTRTPVDVPQPSRQIDFDIETYRGRIYLAGFLETVAGRTVFNPITDWSGDPLSERDLMSELFDRLASYADGDTKVFFWTDYEPNTLKQAAERWDLGIPGFTTVEQWFDQCGVDLHRWTKDRFVSASGYGLKAIAPQCGFHWRDDDPGGQQSEIWFEEMLAGNSEMRSRLLDYNEDDVLAQLAIRRWIVSQDAGLGPGTAIPSVHDWPI